jgi:hypothetical protein
VEQYCIASEVLSTCRENVQLVHSSSAEVNTGCNGLVSMQGVTDYVRMFHDNEETKEPQVKKHFAYGRLPN